MFPMNTDKIIDTSRQGRKVEQELRNIKAQEDALRAARDKKLRQITQCQDQILRMDQYAETAMIRGDEKMARFYLEKKLQWKDQMLALMEEAGIRPEDLAKQTGQETAEDMTEHTPKE